MYRREVACTKTEGRNLSSEMLFGTSAFLQQPSLNSPTSCDLQVSEAKVVRLGYAEQGGFDAVKGFERCALPCYHYLLSSRAERFVE